MIGKSGEHGSIYSGIPNPDIKPAPIIPFGNEHQYRGKNPDVSSGSYLNT